jgi:hypothetical protein
MAYYYFDFRDSKKQDCYGLLSSLIFQLFHESDPFFNILSKLYSDHNHGRKPTLSALKKCMKDMLDQPGQGPIYIIVDALDECPNSSDTPSAPGEVLDALDGRSNTGLLSPREKVLILLEELINLKLPHLYICVTSRPETDIQSVLAPLASHSISLHDQSGHKDDIDNFIKTFVNTDSKMQRWSAGDQELVINSLSEQADGR